MCVPVYEDGEATTHPRLRNLGHPGPLLEQHIGSTNIGIIELRRANKSVPHWYRLVSMAN